MHRREELPQLNLKMSCFYQRAFTILAVVGIHSTLSTSTVFAQGRAPRSINAPKPTNIRREPYTFVDGGIKFKNCYIEKDIPDGVNLRHLRRYKLYGKGKGTCTLTKRQVQLILNKMGNQNLKSRPRPRASDRPSILGRPLARGSCINWKNEIFSCTQTRKEGRVTSGLGNAISPSKNKPQARVGRFSPAIP